MSLLIYFYLTQNRASLIAQLIKNLPAMQETWVRSLDWEDSLEKEMATHFSILAWRIPGTKSPVGYSPWGHKESDQTEQLDTFTFNPKYPKRKQIRQAKKEHSCKITNSV